MAETIALVVLAILALFGDMILLRIWLNVEMVRLDAEKKKTPEPGGTEGGEVKKRIDPMDEGFENIMQFSVGGKMGFERE